jgi:ankyrin repeat protein
MATRKRNLIQTESFIHSNRKNATLQGTDSAKFLLHQACHLFPTNPIVVCSALMLDESSLYNRVRMSERAYSCSGVNMIVKSKNETLSSLPLHIAIECKGSLEVLQYLTRAAPEIVAFKDGPNDCNAISALLYQKRFALDILSMLIRMSPEALLVVDRLQNTSLHVACAQGAPLEVVDMLYEAQPKALFQKNMLGLTPLQLSQQTGLCSMEVSDFLHDLSFYHLECNAHHLLESNTKRQKVCMCVMF